MAKKAKKQKSPKGKTRKTESRAASYAKETVSNVLHQVKEPLSLLNTLKEEGMANAITLLGMASTVASGASKNLRMDMIRPQLKEVVSSLGFATQEDIQKLENRIEELEEKLSQKEYQELTEITDEDE